MATDCFGIEIDQTEYDNWEMLTKGPSGFAEPEGPVDLSAVVIAQNWPPAHLPLPDGILQDARVLEFGCGSGAHLPQVVVRGAMYTGIDISEWSLHCARTRYGHWQQVTLLHTIQDCEQILGMAGELDVVFGTNFFIHQPDERFVKMVETAMLLLRPGGWLSIDRRIGPMTDLGPEQPGSDWRGFQRARADECATVTAAGLALVSYAQPEAIPLREYGIYRKPGGTT